MIIKIYNDSCIKHKIKDCYVDDEYNLTVDYVCNRQFNKYYIAIFMCHIYLF
jgi:hypothetical protein